MTALPDADPSSLTSGPARAWRAGVVALLTVTIGLGCHLAGGGAAPALPVIALVLLPSAVLSWTLSRRRWSVRELLAIFLLAQAAVHLLSMSPLNGAPHMEAMGTGHQMVMSHVGGAVLLVGLVRWGEATLWALVDVLALRPAALILICAAPVIVASVVVATVKRLLPSTWPHTAPGRAPPTTAAYPTAA
ncbi:MAG: hypothetical protein L0H93_09075 [Nocardioides sp.]|nr:hypothetical protein [Nocardioides sp.]